MRRAVRGAALAQLAVLAGLLAGCSQPAEGDGAKPSASATGAAGSAGSGKGDDVAASGGSVGAAGSACELPVAFDTAKNWKAQAIDTGTGTGEGGDEVAAELAEALLHQGPFTAACEIDAKPAGNIGFIRVWTGEAGAEARDARALLKEFVKAEGDTSKAKYSDFTSDSEVSGAEVEYLYTSEALEETKKERAFLTVTADGPVVVHLGGLDTGEHEDMLPAYELARRTLRAT